MITIVCCYNDSIQLQEMLIASLEKQSVDYNLIAINSKKHGFSSAAQAYNAILCWPGKYNVQISDYIVFSHQDIYLADRELLSKIEVRLRQSPNDLLGFAGITEHSKVLSNLKYMSDDSYITKTHITEITEVESLDECCFAMTYQLWKKVRFDEEVCNHWHLYAVDFCYSARKLFDSKSFVLCDEIYHKQNSEEGLCVDRYFLRSMCKMIRKYESYVSTIYAPCYVVSTHRIFSKFKLLRSYLSYSIFQ